MNQASELLQEDSQFIDEESQVGTINAMFTVQRPSHDKGDGMLRCKYPGGPKTTM